MTGPNDPPHPHAASARLDLDRSVSVLLNFLGNKLTASGSAAYRARFGINITEFRVLAMLAVEPDILGQRFTEVIGIDPGATSRTLKALETRGLVLSRPDDRHPAYRRWSLTHEGAADAGRGGSGGAGACARVAPGFQYGEDEARLVDFLRRMLKRMPDLFALNDGEER
jgi:DNA-binding MarR family transcriptional regulator